MCSEASPVSPQEHRCTGYIIQHLNNNTRSNAIWCIIKSNLNMNMSVCVAKDLEGITAIYCSCEEDTSVEITSMAPKWISQVKVLFVAFVAISLRGDTCFSFIICEMVIYRLWFCGSEWREGFWFNCCGAKHSTGSGSWRWAGWPHRQAK